MRELRLFAPAALLMAGCYLLFGLQRQHPVQLARPLRTMPLHLAGFTGSERVVSEEEQRVAGMTDYVFRVFARDAEGFSVYVGYYDSQTTGRTIHSPKNCLPGAGWEALETGTETLDTGPGTRPATVNRYTLANGPHRALVYYWYQGRGRVAHNEYSVKWDLLRDAMRRGRTEEALVRIVVPIVPGSTPDGWRAGLVKAESLARRAAIELMPRVEEMLPAWPRFGSRA
jgi:EpsI family protein